MGALSLLAQPVVGALLGIFVLGDPVLPSTLAGGMCVLLCLAVSGSSQARDRRASVDMPAGK